MSTGRHRVEVAWSAAWQASLILRSASVVVVALTDRSRCQMIYLAIGRLAGSALEKALSPLCVADDNLMVGPSRVDVERHQSIRARYWGAAPSRDVDELVSSGSTRAICVALSPTCNGFLTLCRLCSDAIEAGREVHVMDLIAKANIPSPDGVDPAREVYFDVQRLVRHLPPVVRWSNLEMAVAATLWRLWCRRSPVAFARFCASGSTMHAQIANLGRYHAGIFPRLTERGFSLSRLDELILRQLSEEWATPVRIYANAITRSPQLFSWMTYTGDLYLARRLLEWSRHTQGSVVECRKEVSPGDSEMLAWSFRWHSGGEAVLDELPKLSLAPPVPIGGAVAYDARHASVCLVDSAGTPYLTRART